MNLSKHVAWGILVPVIFASVIVVGSAYVLLETENEYLKKEVVQLSGYSRTQKVNPQQQDDAFDPLLYLVGVFNDKEWISTTTADGKISLSYPKNLFTPQFEKDYFATGIDFKVSKIPVLEDGALDGVCEELGDPDCAAFNLEKQKDLFNKAILNKGEYRIYGETLTLAEKPVTLNGLTFLSAVTVSPNGECALRYVTFKSNVKVEFAADICDDMHGSSLELGPGPWDASSELKTWSKLIVEGGGDFSTEIKRAALLKMISTIK